MRTPRSKDVHPIDLHALLTVLWPESLFQVLTSMPRIKALVVPRRTPHRETDTLAHYAGTHFSVHGGHIHHIRRAYSHRRGPEVNFFSARFSMAPARPKGSLQVCANPHVLHEPTEMGHLILHGEGSVCNKRFGIFGMHGTE